MRALPTLSILLAVLPAAAQPTNVPAHHSLHPGAPRSLGKFGEWQLATRIEAGTTTCFVFTRAEAASQHAPDRGNVVLTVTRRTRSHDVAAISAGFTLSGHEDAPLQAGQTKMLFYIAGRSAFAHDNAAAIAVFGQESSITARLPGPRGVTATDRFSLHGFASAYSAMKSACPAP